MIGANGQPVSSHMVINPRPVLGALELTKVMNHNLAEVD